MELNITLENSDHRVQLFGPADANLRLIREICSVKLTARDGQIKLSGKKEAVDKAARLLEMMQQHLCRADHLNLNDMNQLIHQTAAELSRDEQQQLTVFVHGRRIGPRSKGQEQYINAILKHDLVFCT
ncbi:MAG: hypothetical protein GY869_08610, partial [Planctomycetes bacterium]|nr:hypothetical protein [Planctomycetota bacterium]